jgi:hypothetical protein
MTEIRLGTSAFTAEGWVGFSLPKGIMRSALLALLGFLVLTVPCLSQQGQKQLVLEVLQTDFGVRGTHQFVYLRIFSDRSVEFHTKRNQDLKRDRVSQAQISGEDMSSIAKVLAGEAVANLPSIFKSPYIPIDSYWTLDFSIPRGPHHQKIKVVDFSPGEKQNSGPYPEALVKLVCTVWAVRKNFSTEMPDVSEDCQNFVVKK